MRVTVTGSDGFIGGRVCPALSAAGHEVQALTRSGAAGSHAVGDLAVFKGWDTLLKRSDAVVHLAAMAHVPEAQVDMDLARRVNVEATRALARAACAAGVRRFVYLSTVKVLGEASGPEPFTPRSPLAPASAYARLKAQAEQALLAESGASMDVVILRPPLVYGPGVKANFLRLCLAVLRGRPIPLPARDNRRSLLFVDNLADLVVRAVGHPGTLGQAFLPSDGAPVSTAGLVRALGVALGRPARILSLPWPLLVAGAALAGRRPDLERVAGSLFVEDPGLQQLLGWSPPHSFESGLSATAAWLRSAAT